MDLRKLTKEIDNILIASDCIPDEQISQISGEIFDLVVELIDEAEAKKYRNSDSGEGD